MLTRSILYNKRLYSSLADKISISPQESSDISHDLREIPTSTGSGPFIEFPTFEPLGPSSSLLNVKLPASSILNLRSNSILAANGELNNISSQLTLINLWTKPLIYNEISSTSPISLVISNSNKSFISLDVSNEEWYVLNSNYLEGWYGNFNISRNFKLPGLKIKSDDNYNKNLILSGEGQLFTLKLDQQEDILLNISSIVGFTGQNGTIIKRDIGSIGIPRLGLVDSIKIQYQALSKIINPGARDSVEQISLAKDVSKDDKAIVESKQPTWFDSIKKWGLTKLNKIKYHNKVFYQIKGPATIIIQNQTNPISKIFTNEELQNIYNQLKQ